ncbi:WD repeat-containing 44-like [Olea europaea subsp. europaea]|uniref:WD repeat-containing 44-like n=1 Tax=Olea europaea subsp. europaea TaxID=158383 RepID=A0A8S0V3V2_OLEEU|nr:WD repeat-containing 44-like [Olea europaea subsp. europaea]
MDSLKVLNSVKRRGYDMWMAEPGYKDFLRVTTTKFVRGISSLMFFLAKLLLPLKNRKKKDKPEDDAEAEASPEAPIMFVRSRLDGDIESFSVKKKKPKELIGPDSKQRLTRTLSGKIAYSTELDIGKEFIVKESNEKRKWNKLNNVETRKQLAMEGFEVTVGYSRFVKEVMACAKPRLNGSKQTSTGNPAKNLKLCTSQEIQAHDGSIWTIKFSWDARFLASSEEDSAIHVWEVQECDVMSTRSPDNINSLGETPVHQMAGTVSNRPPLAEITPMPSEMMRRGRKNRKKGN